MRTRKWIGLILSLFAASLALVGCASVPTDVEGEGAQNLQLLYGDGAEEMEGVLPASGELRVYWFWSSQSQCSRRAEPGIEALAVAYPEVELIVVHSNADESAQEGRQVAKERKLAAPLYRDEGARLAVEFDARMTPEVVVVDAEGVVYQGRPVSFDGDELSSFVEEVVDSWKRGEEIEPDYRRPSGCVIRRP